MLRSTCSMFTNISHLLVCVNYMCFHCVCLYVGLQSNCDKNINNSGIHILCYTCLCEQNVVIVNDFKVYNLTMKKI